MASAAFHFATGPSLAKYAATAAQVIPLVLDSVDGVRTIVWSVQSTDETSAGGWVVTNPTSITGATLTAPAGADKACIVSCVVNGGTETDARTGLQVAGDLRKTAKAYIADEVVAVGEVNESDATYGWAPIVNDVIRNVGAAAGTVLPLANELVLRDGTGQAFATAFRGPAAAGTSLQSQAGQAVAVTGATGATLTATTGTAAIAASSGAFTATGSTGATVTATTGAAAIAAGAGTVTLTATGATSDITLDAGRDVILDVGSTADEISIRAGGVTKATITPGVSTTTIAVPQSVVLSGTTATVLSSTAPSASVVASGAVVTIGDDDTVAALTITPNGAGGTTTIAGFQPLAISAAGAMSVQPAQATAGVGHALTVSGGAAQSGAGGNATVQGGGAAGTNQAGGDIVLRPGLRTGSGAASTVTVADESGTGRMFVNWNSATSAINILTAKGAGNGIALSGSSMFIGGETMPLAIGPSVSGSLTFRGTSCIWQGGTTTYERKLVGAVLAAASTTTTVVTYATEANRVYQVIGQITVSNDTDDEGAAYYMRAAFKRVAGVVTQIGATQTIAADLEDAGQTGLSAAIDFSGTDIRLRLTNDAADIVTANGMLTIYERVLA